MNIDIFPNARDMGRHAAELGVESIKGALDDRGEANIVVSAGASQLDVFHTLTARDDIDWSHVTGFHLGEYLGLSIEHPASFRKYLQEQFVDLVPLAGFHFIAGEVEPVEECRRVGELITRHPIDVAFVGIGENGRVALNDPPADFETEEPYIIVELDEACRSRQFDKSCFPTLDDVPRRAISISIRQVLKSKTIICSVPDERKAAAVKAAALEQVTPNLPASVLQEHSNTTLFLDDAAASLLK